MKESWYTNRIYQILFHQVPAHGVDLLCKVVGKKPFLTRFVPSGGPVITKLGEARALIQANLLSIVLMVSGGRIYYQGNFPVQSKASLSSRATDMIVKSCSALEPFTTQSWTWSTTNVRALEVRHSIRESVIPRVRESASPPVLESVTP